MILEKTSQILQLKKEEKVHLYNKLGNILGIISAMKLQSIITPTSIKVRESTDSKISLLLLEKIKSSRIYQIKEILRVRIKLLIALRSCLIIYMPILTIKHFTNIEKLILANSLK